ncbi:MAG: Phosphatidylserine decarboxylase proenzyme [Verrucomicrobia subdivision 3 bacterium]|nr:Phosphatidylserine decarboxylase proenzyme [Limisphaerales bacterium]MCS1413868.1 Phosphatidylserine decarboxylase proenzyme [Limisphaerales bacterium]
MNRPASCTRIKPFMETFGIDPNEFRKTPDQFNHFNEFFARELKAEARPIDSSARSAVFPADGRHLGFQNLSEVRSVFVKGQTFNLPALLQDPELAKRYARGTAVVSRLCPTDYHRFHFALSGHPGKPRLIAGPLYSVNPLALRRNLSFLWQNRRMITNLSSPDFGQVAIIEFGATSVGSIRQTFQPEEAAAKGQEKGYFLFGGSATMTFFEPGKVDLAEDLLANTKNQREIYAQMGDVMAHLRS